MYNSVCMLCAYMSVQLYTRVCVRVCLSAECKSVVVLLTAMYTCSDGAVLRATARCNGNVECSDGADENNCSELSTS